MTGDVRCTYSINNTLYFWCDAKQYVLDEYTDECIVRLPVRLYYTGTM